MTRTLTLALIATLTTTAVGGIYVGNPTIVGEVNRPDADFIGGTVLLDKVRIHACDGRHRDYSVDAWIDPVDPAELQVDIAGGDLCYAEYFWGSDMILQAKAVTLKVSTDGNPTLVDLDPLTPTLLTNWVVVAGELPNPSQHPRLTLTVQ